MRIIPYFQPDWGREPNFRNFSFFGGGELISGEKNRFLYLELRWDFWPDSQETKFSPIIVGCSIPFIGDHTQNHDNKFKITIFKKFFVNKGIFFLWVHIEPMFEGL